MLNGDLLNAGPQSSRHIRDALLMPMSWLASHSLPCIFLRGNHEARGGEAGRLKSYLLQPDNRYYSAMTLGDMRLVLLDCGETRKDRDCYDAVDFETHLAEQQAWFAGEIESTPFKEATWRLVVLHIPPHARGYAKKMKSGAALESIENLVPLFNKGRVTAVFSGHSHTKAVLEPLATADDPGWPVFTAGGNPFKISSLIRVDLDSRKLAIKIINNDGTIFAERAWKADGSALP